jgi:hypothetical protein
MEAMRESWTDARLDDFAAHTDRRFDEVDRRFDSLERRMEAGFAEINVRFDALQRVLVQGVIVLSSSIIAGFAALIGLIATQL